MAQLKRVIFGCLALMLVMCNVIFMSELSSVPVAYAAGLEDNVSGGDAFGGSVSEDDMGVGNWIKKQRGMTTEQLNTASRTLSPLTNMAGYFVGGAITIIFAGVFVMTALDLIYITIPPIRSVLYDGGGQQQGGGMMGGMGGMGRFGGGMMGGQQGGQQEQKRQWISDEAVQCAAMLGGGGQQQGGGMGMGGMGGMGMMGGMGGMGGQQQPMSTKSVIGMYFKKRIVFMILLAICAIVLTSSALLGTGVNLAQWLLKLIDMINGYVPQ